MFELISAVVSDISQVVLKSDVASAISFARLYTQWRE